MPTTSATAWERSTSIPATTTRGTSRVPSAGTGRSITSTRWPDKSPARRRSQSCGHIPTAASVPWATGVNAEDRTFKSVDELKEIYGGKGIVPNKEVIAYCRIGERSAHTWFVLKELLGYPDVKNYDGSWTEWGSSIRLPIEK